MQFTTILAMLTAASCVTALPSVMIARGSAAVDPNAVTGTKCTSPSTKLVSHDINVALLSICGSIAGTIQQCAGSPTSTTGKSGTASFALKAVTAGTTIDITKGRWEHCVAAARATCGDSPFTSTCIGGANGNSNNVAFTLSAA
ncbi:hypothetical protein BP6252_01692 [Coleophoma cylindrospora]|uniref:Uncharacterized protein n=1 Tax=Coleophoma cylindrospora TaxID=1849047 RepID=A0A3D8STL4_9HELO|nr:hypothetical protein BP6252_01692 [Coleophoma cylindrospora]